MTREQALSKLRRLFGAGLHWRVYSAMSSPEKREAARIARQDIKARIEVINADIAERMKQLGIPELQAQRRTLRKEDDTLLGDSIYWKFEAGRRDGIFISNCEHGDTWEEVIAKVEAAAAQKKAS